MRRLQIAAAGIVLSAWCIALGDGMLTGDYSGADIATPVVVIALGFVFGDSFLRSRYGNGDEERHDDP